LQACAFKNLNIFGDRILNVKMVKYRTIFLFVVAMFISCNNPSNKPLPVFVPNLVSEEVQAPIPETEIQTLDSLLTRVMKNYRFNGNALVAIEGYPVFEYSSGYADLYTKTPLNFNTAF